MPTYANRLRSARGQSIIEFALALPIFVLVFFAIVEFAHLFYVRLTLQHALREAARFASTGQGQQGGDVNARTNQIKTRFCDLLLGTGLTCPEIVSETSDFSIACDGACSMPGGGPDQTVILTARFTKPWFTVLFNQFAPGGVTLTLSTTVVNYGFVTVRQS